MRSPVTKHKSLWLGCLLFVMLCGPVRADVSGEITGVKIDPDTRTITMSCNGKVGKHLARVIGQPNRLIMDFADTAAAKVPPKIGVNKADIHEIRVGANKSRTRVVVDFQDRPVPAFKVRRQDDQIQVIFGNSMADQFPAAQARSGDKVDALAPEVVPAAAKAQPTEAAAVAANLHAPSAPVIHPASTDKPAVAQAGHKTVSAAPDRAKYNWLEGAAKQGESHDKKLAQSMEPPSKASSSMGPTERRTLPAPKPTAGRVSAGVPGSPEETAGRAMVREVRPPVTPPTPDPRLLVQEITELKFVQVGHNARLIIRGGDKLDYRMNNVSPTKLRIDLINAEIPKVHQKPLKTDQFSTSVEMIVPGSQTIFVQLKDSVPAQVEKKTGVLMIDFPPPRFTLVHSREREGGGEAAKIIHEEELKKSIDRLNADIERLQKGQEQLQKQRNEILRAFQVTPDPEIFNKPVTMDFQGISLKNAFRLLAEQAGINIIVNADVAGTTTLRLFEVPLGQVIDTIMTTNGLDRVMVGNVMRVGTKNSITQYKTERRKEYLQRIGEVDKRLADNRKEAEDDQKKIEQLLEELKKLQEAPVEDTRSEEIGEAGCIDIEGEKVCFAYATVRLTYSRPTQVVNTLDCMFNLQCGGARRRGGTTNIAVQDQYQQGLANERALAMSGRADRGSYQQYLSDQGFSPDSPGARARMQTTDRTQADLERAQAARTTSAGIGAAAATAQVALPWGEDPKLARIIAYSMLWPDDVNRMIFIKDTPDRIAQMRKLIYTLDVPTPQVLIETRLVRASKNWSRGLGIIWGMGNNQNGPQAGNTGTAVGVPYDSTYQKRSFWGFGSAGTGTVRNITNGTASQPQGTPFSPLYLVNLPAIAGFVTGVGMNWGFLTNNYLTQLDLTLQMGEASGYAKVISRPKVQVLDGQTANIQDGQTIAFQTVSADGTQTQLIPVVKSLNVSPRIYSDGRVQMTVTVTDNDVDRANLTNGLATILTRSANTVLIVKDGETAVIGGLMTESTGGVRNGIPGLMNVPILNTLFTGRNKSKDLTELLVFLTPTIIRRPPPAS